MHIDLPELCLVMLVGATSSGKSSFARRHFLPTEIISSDYCRAMLADDESDQSVTPDAFELMRLMVSKRLKFGRLAVVDATNVQAPARREWIALAREHDVFCVAIVFDLPEVVLVERHKQRAHRDFGEHVIRKQRMELRRSLRGLEREGCRYVHVLHDAAHVDAVTLARTRLWTNLRHESGPFDIIGDVHGCLDELLQLCRSLGYVLTPADGSWQVRHPDGRRLVFVGDLVDRGQDTPGVLRLVQGVVRDAVGFCVAGNHDDKLARALAGRKVRVTHGLERSLAQLEAVPDEERRSMAAFLDGLISHYVLDGGRLVVAHAGLAEAMQGRTSERVRRFAMYGETTGETDEFGLPVRHDWAQSYRGKAMVVYGHTPAPQAEWLNHTICVDTGCVFGGHLTALRYPERELVSVPAAREYYPPQRPLGGATPEPAAASAQMVADDMLDLAEVAGRRFIRTVLGGSVLVAEENAAAALEAMSRFAANPRWLIHLPPTMSPSETSALPGLLEHPAEALGYYRQHGVMRVVCEEKHMGSRAIVIVCRSEAVAARRFGVADEGIGIVYTRTGRAFFNDEALEQALLGVVADAVDRAGLWDELATDWLCLDCELLPWSAKAIDLVRNQYAPVAVAGVGMLATLQGLLAQARAEGRGFDEVEAGVAERLQSVRAYRDAFGRYCRDVAGPADLRLAPFHVLASEDHVHIDRDHGWHMAMTARLAAARPDLIMATPSRVVDLQDPADCAAATAWWAELTAAGGEGMVVKPFDFIVRDARGGLLQPAIKCRGADYLRIIYGPEYLRPANLDRLRQRGVGAKRALARKEFALGIEALSRFVGREPLRSVHECVFGVLALESEPVDPRL